MRTEFERFIQVRPFIAGMFVFASLLIMSICMMVSGFDHTDAPGIGLILGLPLLVGGSAIGALVLGGVCYIIGYICWLPKTRKLWIQIGPLALLISGFGIAILMFPKYLGLSEWCIDEFGKKYQCISLLGFLIGIILVIFPLVNLASRRKERLPPAFTKKDI